MNNCLFCKIVSGEVPATKIYEDESTLAFLDINPVNPGHTLVIPKRHSRNIFDIEKEDLINVTNNIQKIAKAVKIATNSSGINIISNNEPTAGQVIFHTHIHIVPRFTEDGFKQWAGTPYNGKGCEKVAEKIKMEL